MNKNIAIGAIITALAVGQMSATQIVYEPTSLSDQPGFGSVNGANCGLCGRGGIDGLNFWTFTGTAGQSVDITVTRFDDALDPAFALFFGTTTADDSTIPGQHLYWGGDWPQSGMILLAYADDEVPFPGGPFGDPQLLNFHLPYTGAYTVVVSGGTGSDIGKLNPAGSSYLISLDPGQLNVDATPEPSTYLLLGTGLAGLAAAARRRKSI